MLDGAFEIRFAGCLAAEKISDYLLPAERSKSKRRHELARAARHHHLYREILLLQAADEFRGFVGCDSSGDAEGDAHKILKKRCVRFRSLLQVLRPSYRRWPRRG